MLYPATTSPPHSTGALQNYTPNSDRPTGDQETRLGLSRMDPIVQSLFNQGIAEATRATYRSGWRQYTQFCETHHLPPLPVNEDILCQFVATMSETLGWGTIRSYLSAVRFTQISAGLADPTLSSFPRLTYVMRGIRKKTPQHTRPKRLPITPDILRKIYAIWATPPVTFDKRMLWAACCLGFFGFMRAGEFTCTTTADHTLRTSDISIDSREDPQVLTVLLRHSKTDPFGAGVHLHLGRTGETLCPVSAMLGYLAMRPGSLGPLFIFENGTPLSKTLLIRYLRDALQKAGVSTDNYTGHSFRIGAASAAAQAGLSDSLIQSLGRWKSSAFTTYIRTPVEQLVSVSARLAMTQAEN